MTLLRTAPILLALAGGCAARPPGPGAHAAARAALPDTAPGRLFAEWLRLFEAGDRARLVAFFRAHAPVDAATDGPARTPEQRADFALLWRSQAFGLDVVAMEASTATRLVVVTRDRHPVPGFDRHEVEVDPAHPERLVRHDADWAEAPEGAVERLAPERLDAALDPLLRDAARLGAFSGVVLVARHGLPVFAHAYGLADREAGTPNRLDTAFRLGSMNKIMTAVAVAQLVDEGKLSFDDPLAKVLPDYPDAELARKITIRQLLTHTSGLGNVFGPRFMERRDAVRTLPDYLALFQGEPLRFEPGARFDYSNAGFVVLGLVVEKLTGQTYYDAVAERIFARAGMTRSGFSPKDAPAPGLAVGYTRRPPDGAIAPNGPTLPGRGSSAGGGEATAADLVRFAEALRTGALVPRPLADALCTGRVDTPFQGARYGYGCEERRVHGARVVGHGGGAPGMSTSLQLWWDEGVTVVVLANADPPAAERVAFWIRDRLDAARTGPAAARR